MSFESQFGGFYKEPRVQAMDLSNFEYDHSWSMEDCRSITKAMVVAERRTNDPTQVNSTGRVCARTTMRSVQASSTINCITEFRFPVLSLHYGPPWNCQGTAANSIRRGEQLIEFIKRQPTLPRTMLTATTTTSLTTLSPTRTTRRATVREVRASPCLRLRRS